MNYTPPDEIAQDIQRRLGRTACPGCGMKSGPTGEDDGLVLRLTFSGRASRDATCNYCDFAVRAGPTGPVSEAWRHFMLHTHKYVEAHPIVGHVR